MRKIKTLLKNVIPKEYHPKAFFNRWIFSQCRGVVRAGPFQGMLYVRQSVGSALCPKLLGLYERELEPLAKQLCALDFATIIDIGAAEGYYAVGFALCSTNSSIIAFESTPEGQALIREMAKLNRVSARIDVRGHCDQEQLLSLIKKHPESLLVIDVEGAETDLFGSAVVSFLARCHLLIELHEFISRDIPQLLRSRFEATHSITEIWSTERDLSELPFKVSLLRRYFSRWLSIQITDERPEKMRWFYLQPLSVN